MRLIRLLIICITLAAHLVGSIAYAGPQFIEICTVHGVEIVPSDEAADSCEICLAVCDFAASGADAASFEVPGVPPIDLIIVAEIAESEPAIQINNRDPPLPA